MIWRCQVCGHKLKEIGPASKEFQPNIPKVLPTKISFVKGNKAYNLLKGLASPNIKDLANWTYTALLDKVYVRGSKGFVLWKETAPQDLRSVIILELD